MNRLTPATLTVIRQQKRLRKQVIPWRVIAELSGVSTRAVLKAAKRLS